MADPDIATMSVDIMNCDREPVHIAGAILPHGAMLVLDGDTLEVLQAAGDTSRLLVGVPLGELLGQSAATLFSPDQIENLRGLAAALDLVKPRHMLDPQLRVINGQPLDASLHRSAGSLVLEFEAADIPQQACALYVKNWLRLITQVDYDAAPLVPAANPRTGAPPDMSQAILRNVSPIHREYLRNMGIDASMSIQIIRGGKLWGLIACHHYSPRILSRHLRAICELLGSMFSLQLEAREKGEQFDERLASRMVLQNLMLNLASADDYAAGLSKESPNLLDYIHCGLPSVDGTRQGGVAVSVKGQLTFLGITPSQIQSFVGWLDTHVAKNEGVFSTNRLGEVQPPGAAFADVASGVLVISVSEELSDFIIWFRPELVGTSSWGGEPTKLVTSGPNGNRLSPRKSFEV